ncbi:MAG: DUF2079 domain-containing protein, partial [Gloeomargarita sp. SKYG98]|nr:DUF2079 domain-containing protein [Gloeomargarita sp. SKYG98]
MKSTVESPSQSYSLYLAAAIFFITIASLLLIRYVTFFATYDQGIFNQVYWNSLHGRFFESSLSSGLSVAVRLDGDVPSVFYRRLGQHFTPALMVWLPIYALAPSPVTLIFLQALLLTAGGIVLYFLARHWLEPRLAWWITTSYYGAGAVIGPALGNFHDAVQLPLFLFGAVLSLEKRHWWLFWALIFLTLMIREDTGIVVFGMGVYWLLSRRFPWVGLAVCALSFLYVVLVTNVAMPLFSDDLSRRFLPGYFGQVVGDDIEVASTLDILKGILTNPLQLLTIVGRRSLRILLYILGHWLPLGFVPALSWPAWVMVIFPLGQRILQNSKIALLLNVRYAINLVPAIFYGAILWWRQHQDRLNQRWQSFWRWCIGVSVALIILANPNQTFSWILPDSVQPWVWVPLQQRWQHRSAIQALIKQIPNDATVAATNQLVPPLSSRRGIVRFPQYRLRLDNRQIVSADYIVTDLWYWRRFNIPLKNAWDIRQLHERITSGEYGIIELQDEIVLLKKGETTPPSLQTQWQAL